jgi:SOS-response transcriptional repressor LexA
MTQPNARQLEILTVIADHVQSRGFVPTARELMKEFGWTSTNAVRDHFGRLARKGLLAVERNGYRSKRRAYSITEAGWVALNRSPTGRLPALDRITGYCDPPSARCFKCGRVFFRGAEAGHECRADDIACVRGAA